jgi:hypothetical protein
MGKEMFEKYVYFIGDCLSIFVETIFVLPVFFSNSNIGNGDQPDKTNCSKRHLRGLYKQWRLCSHNDYK